MKKLLNFLKKFKYIAVGFALASLIVGTNFAHADITNNYWVQNAANSLATNTSNGLAGGDIHVAHCWIGITNTTPCSTGGGPGSGTVTNFSFTNANGFSGTVTNPTTTPALSLTTSLTQNSIPFIGAAGALTENINRLVWKDSQVGLGVGTIWPATTNLAEISPLMYSTGTASQTTTVITGVGTTFTDDMVGKTFIFADGTTRRITAFTNTTTLTVTPTGSVGSQAFEIHYPGLSVGGLTSTTPGGVGVGVQVPGAQFNSAATGSTAVTTRAGLFSNTKTSATNNLQKRGVEISSSGTLSGTGTTNMGLFITQIAGATNNYDAVINGGTGDSTLIGAAQNGTGAAYGRLYVSETGAKTTSGAGLTVQNTATSSTASIAKYGLRIDSTGTWNGSGATNTGLYIPSVTNGTVNYGAVIQGNVGLQNTAPGELLTLGTPAVIKGVLSFAGNTSGKVIVQPKAIAGTWTLTLPDSAGTSNQVLTTDGTGITSWTTPASGLSLTTIGAAPNANGATLTGSVLNLEPASASFGGVVTTGTQTFAGNKEFTGNIGIGVVPTLSALIVEKSVTGDYVANIYNDDATGYGLFVGGEADTVSPLFLVQSSRTELFQVAGTGGVAFNGIFGTPGYILQSNGSGASPTWIDPASITIGSLPINHLLAATGTNSIDNANYQQTWSWNSLGTNSQALVIQGGGSSMVTASYLATFIQGGTPVGSVTTAASRFITTTQNNGGTDFGIEATATNSGTGSGIAGYFLSDGAISSNIAVYASAPSGLSRYAIIVPPGGGNVGIQNSAPGELLSLGTSGAGAVLGTLGFHGNTSGVVTMQSAAAAGTWTMTLPTTAGTSGQVLVTNGSGVTSWTSSPSLVSVPLNHILSATGTNTIDNLNFNQTWDWSTLSTQTALDWYSDSTAASGNTQTLMALTLIGANANSTQTTVAAIIGNGHTGTASTNIGLRVSASGGSNNYALVVPSGGGSVGIGTQTPSEKLEIVGNLRLSGAFMPNNDPGTVGQYLVSTGAGSNPVWQSGSPSICGSGDISGLTVNATLASCTSLNNGVYNFYHVSAYANVTAVGGGGTVTVAVTYQDQHNVTQTETFTNQGATVPGISTATVSNYPVMGEIAVWPNTTIEVDSKVTVGTATYDAGADITYIRTPAL